MIVRIFLSMLEKGSVPTAKINLMRIRWGMFLAVLGLSLGMSVFGPPVFAQIQESANGVAAVGATAGINGQGDLLVIIGRIVNIFLGTLGIILLAYLLYAGYLWMTAGGEPKQIDEAKSHIRNAIIGMVIIASSFALTRFILSQLRGAADGGSGGSSAGGSTVSFPTGAGALGKIIESHIPVRDAVNVPRNTTIVITFKEPVSIPSLIKGYDEKGTPADLTDDIAPANMPLNLNGLQIFRTGDDRNPLPSDGVKVSFTPDRKTFVFRPNALLGSPTVHMGYTVRIMPGTRGVLWADGSAAFGSTNSSGYRWSFDVSTKVDLTPPKLLSVIPVSRPSSYAPNIVVQMQFDKPIDPTSASGIFRAAARTVFTNIELRSGSGSTLVEGQYRIGNEYKTVEFTTFDVCGVNSCGNTVYCLPRNQRITGVVKAATLENSSSPRAQIGSSGYDGIVDTSGNSLDGNGDGKASGPTDDNYTWTFQTNNTVLVDPPRVRKTTPSAPNGGNSPSNEIPSIEFDDVMQVSTIQASTTYLEARESSALTDTFWFTSGQELVSDATHQPVYGRIFFRHRLYALSPTSTNADGRLTIYYYIPHLTSGLQTIYQNCFKPSSSYDPAGAPGNVLCSGPNCCDNHPSDSACTFN